MPSYSIQTELCKQSSEITNLSTGTDPAGWRAWWAAESKLAGTDWHTLIDSADAALSRLRIMTMCQTCGSDPCINPNFCTACRDADRRKARGEHPHFSTPGRPIDWRSPSDRIPDNWQEMSIEALLAHFDRIRRREGAPEPTVEALMYSLREGVKALEETSTKRRLSELSERQLHEVCGRLQRLKPHIAPAWVPEQITALVDAWNNCHG
jgi:hypothetical protein